MIDAWLHGLLLQTLTLSLATIAVRVLQAAAMRRLGAAAGYLCWLLVPVAMLAVALPHPAVDALAVRVDVSAITPAWIATAPVEGAARGGTAATLAAATWIAGALLLAALLVQRQRRFEALVGVPTSDATHRLPAGAGPAVLGVWRRRIVLPQDFDSAFDTEERRLMLLHEGVHLRRADNLWNLLAAALLVLHWFNPFAWWAWRRMRTDQESSCDAAVLRHEPPAALGIYAAALLKVQGVALTPPLATSWQSSHPLVERVRMLQLHRISSARHRAGLRIAALLIVLAGIGGYTVHSSAGTPAADTSSIMTDVELTSVQAGGSGKVSCKLLARAGQKVTVRFDSPEVTQHVLSAPVEVALVITRLDARQLQIDVTLRRGNPLVVLSSPRVVTADGTPAHIDVKSSDGGYDLALTLVPRMVEGISEKSPATNDARKG